MWNSDLSCSTAAGRIMRHPLRVLKVNHGETPRGLRRRRRRWSKPQSSSAVAATANGRSRVSWRGASPTLFPIRFFRTGTLTRGMASMISPNRLPPQPISQSGCYLHLSRGSTSPVGRILTRRHSVRSQRRLPLRVGQLTCAPAQAHASQSGRTSATTRTEPRTEALTDPRTKRRASTCLDT